MNIHSWENNESIFTLFIINFIDLKFNEFKK